MNKNEMQEEIGYGTVEDIIQAIEIVDKIGIPPKRPSKGQCIKYKLTGKKYPMKYVVDVHYALKKTLIIKSQDDVNKVINKTKEARAYLKEVKGIKDFFDISEPNSKEEN